MSFEHEVLAIRTSTALSAGKHVACVRLSGEDAFDVLDRTCTSDLYLQDAQMRLSLLLTENGTTLADIYVCRDDEDYLVLADGLSPAELVDVFRQEGRRVEVRNESETHELWSLHGPFAWELLAEVIGPDVIGLPYLSLFHVDGMTLFRGGKTGEYGYDLLLPKADASNVRQRILSAGAAFDVAEVSQEAVDLCSLENWFFNARREGREGLGPLELGLQWRVSYQKEYAGSAALAAQRKAGVTRRVTCALAKQAVQPGHVVSSGAQQIGTVIRAEHSPLVKAHVAMVLLDRAYAHSGIDAYRLETPEGPIPMRTVSPPVINNRSLYVNSQRHSYATRDKHTFPALV